MLSSVFALVFFCLCLYAGVKDTLTFTIPNWMNLTFLGLFVPAAFASQIGWGVAGAHILVGVAALIIGYGLFAFRVLGGGDAKMIPGVMLWIGPDGALLFILGMAVAGGALSIVVLIARKSLPVEVAPGFARKILTQENGIPYGCLLYTSPSPRDRG